MYRFFESRVDPFPPGVPRQPPNGFWPFVLYYSRPMLPWIVLMSILMAALALVEVLLFSFIGRVVDWLGAADRATFFADYGWGLAAMLFVIVVAFPLLVLVHSLVMHQTIFGIYPMLVRWQAHRYVLRQSMSFFQDEFAGRVSQKVMQTALAVRETVMKLADVLVYVTVYFTGAALLLASADIWLAVPLLAWLAAYIGVLYYFVPRMRRISMVQADARAMMTGRVVDSYTNIQTVKLFAHSTREHDYARAAMDEFLETVRRQMRLVTRLTTSLNFINALLLAAIATIAVFGWQREVVSLGAIAVAAAIVMRIRSMSQWILWEIASLFENVGTVQDGINTIARPLAIDDRPDAPELKVTRGEIRFEDIRFHYGKEGGVIDRLDLTIRPGERVGIVGRSGAGKSTLVNLLLRFYEPESGRILIDGQNVTRVTQESLRRQVGLVTQDTSLLHRSLRDNIAYGRPDASEAEIVEAARQAHADEFIQTLSDPKGRYGYDAHVGERGVKLSGGQRQRIAIARVLLKDAPILVLDEATSALDSEVEAAIQESFQSLTAGKTVIAIAHRLSTIAAMDRLIVLEAGQIVETGTHDELVARDGLYAGLWRRQSGGFLDVGAEPLAGEAAE